MRSPALKQLFFLLTLSLMLGITTSEARTPVSIRFIAGASQAGAYEVDGNLGDPTLLLGFGARYQLTRRHSIVLDIERIERNIPPRFDETDLTDFALSREPLTEANGKLSPYWPITLGYQFEFLSGAANRISPHFTLGVSMLRTSVTSAYSRYPNLDVNSSEEIESDSKVTQTDFGFSLGIGCSARINSFLSISLDGRFRDLGVPVSSYYSLGRPDTQQNIGGSVFQGSDFDSDPRGPRTGTYEAKLILEFRL